MANKKNIINIDKLLGKPTLHYEKFHAKTKIKKLLKDIDRKYWPEEWKKVYYKGYSRFPEVILPKPYLSLKKSYKSIIEKRKSEKHFVNNLTTKALSTLLYYSAGLKKKNESSRFYPSAGGRYPLEIYLISLRSEIPQGLYHYYVKNSSLERLDSFKKQDLTKYVNQDWIKDASCIVIITAVFERTVVKYGERGYRHVLMEAGFLTQNIYLNCAALELSCCGIGGYVDDNLHQYLDIDGITESVVGMIAIG